jgi:mono/diheme cytochrome c family protein
MRFRNLNFLVALTLAGAFTSAAQETTPTAKPTNLPATSPASGKEMFMSYCASCHGKSATGDGPAGSALKQAPADLTRLAKRNGGKYPANKVTSILRGQTRLVAHGDQDMPIWGPVFWKMSQGHEERVQMRIANLNRYLESVQEK